MTLKTIFFSLIAVISLTVLMVSCDNSNSYTSREINTVTDSTPNANFTIVSFPEFWKKFRQAVIDNDSAKIILLTHFPLETRGEMDEAPIVKYDKKDFTKIFHAYLNQESGLSAEKETELDYIKKSISPNGKNNTENWARVGDLEFKNIDGFWYLTFAYLNLQDKEL